MKYTFLVLLFKHHKSDLAPIVKYYLCLKVSIGEDKLAAGPLVAKVYDASLIKVTDIGNALVGQQCQFRGKYYYQMLLPFVYPMSNHILLISFA